MRFTSFLFLILLSCSRQKKDISEIVPEYKFIVTFAEKIKKESGLLLWCYGINNGNIDYDEIKNGVVNFSSDYALNKTRQDVVSLDEARVIFVHLVESFLEEINTDLEIRPKLDFFPFPSTRLRMSLIFRDENRIELGSGVSKVRFSGGNIEYQRYEISHYTGHYPAEGKRFLMHKETYEEALEIVKKQSLSESR